MTSDGAALNRAVAATSLVEVGDVRAAKRALRAALRELDRRPQRLPAWVVPGALVEWRGEGRHDVFRVTEVRREKSWRFSAERVWPRSESGARTVTYFFQERGRRHWRKFTGRQLPLFAEPGEVRG